mgnify:CR=1 FL=1
MKETLKKYLPIAIFTSFYFLFIDDWFRYALFVIGVIMATILLILDEEKLYSFYQETEHQEGAKDIYLATRSTLFLLTLIPLAFFVVSSTGSAIGSGFVLGLILNLVSEMWLLRDSPEQFSIRFLSQLKKKLSPIQIKFVIWGSIVFFVILNLWSAIIR